MARTIGGTTGSISFFSVTDVSLSLIGRDNYLLIMRCGILVGVHECHFQGHSYKIVSFDDQCLLNENFCSYGLEKISMDSHKDATARYEHHTQPL